MRRGHEYAAAVFIALAAIVQGCRRAPAPPAAASARPAAAADAAAPAGAPGMSAKVRRPSRACAYVEIGFDRRAWPTNEPQAGFDMDVRGFADDFRRAAPAGAAPRMYTQPGWNTMSARFDGTTEEEVLARCKQTLAKFLPRAPKLPTSEQGPDGRFRIPSATSVIVRCQRCP